MAKSLLISALLLGWLLSSAQVKPVLPDAALEQLKNLADSIQKGTSDTVRMNSALVFDSLMHEVLKKDGSMDFDFDSLKNLSVLTDKNKLIRVYTFICPLTEGKQYRYFGFIQWKNKKSEKPVLIKLKDAMPERPAAEKLMLNSENWLGALYYKLISVSVKGKNYYTLLGWRGLDGESTMKVIEVLTIEKGNAWFGAPVFLTENGARQRILFEYNARAVMSLTYDEKKKRIVFDHLSPPSSQLTGNFKTYGPDFTYDAYQWKQGKWMLLKNVEPRNPPSTDAPLPSQKIKRKVLYKPEG